MADVLNPIPIAARSDDRTARLSARERKTFIACCGGVALDGMDNAFYTLAMPALIATWHVSCGALGVVLTISLLAASIGGWVAGALSDRYGRVRVLQFSILWFSLFSFVSAFAPNLTQLAVWRTIYALGFGGEMAVSIALIGEIASAERRGTMLGLMHGMFSAGSAVASLVYAACFTLFDEHIAWRALFVVGSFPALLVLYLRRNVVETVPVSRRTVQRSDWARIFGSDHIVLTVLGSMIAWGTLAGVAGVQTWLPTYLSRVRHLSVLNTTANIVLYQLSHFLGYLVGGYLADRFGRRPSFILSSLLSLASVLAYTMLPLSDFSALLLSIPMGFFTATIYGAMAALFTESFPLDMRGSGVAFCYNCGRALAAFAPALIGLTSQVMPLASAIGIFAAAAYGIVIIAALLTPETRGARVDRAVHQD